MGDPRTKSIKKSLRTTGLHDTHLYTHSGVWTHTLSHLQQVQDVWYRLSLRKWMYERRAKKEQIKYVFKCIRLKGSYRICQTQRRKFMALKKNHIYLETEMNTKSSSGGTQLQMYTQHVVDHVTYCRLMVLNLAEGAYVKA